MYSEDYENRWHTLAEIHFGTEKGFDDENYIYCLCSRVFIRGGVKVNSTEKHEGSESDTVEAKVQDIEDESHVHFSNDTSDKVKCEKDEGASCYCSATHTDNYYSTDEHDPTQPKSAIINVLQPSDSGADLTYQEFQSDCTNQEPTETMEQDLPENITDFEENYLSEGTFEKFWAINGERLIWASWIKKYSNYINPSYLDDNNDLIINDNNIQKENSTDQIQNVKINDDKDDFDNSTRTRTFSYDSKVNPYKKDNKGEKNGPKDDSWLGRRRSCSEHDRMASPKTLAQSDSMTNVTKLTLSSYDNSSSHVTSESTDEYSVSSSTSEDPSNDQTRIGNSDDNTEMPNEEMDVDQYWQLLWKKHFGEQYALHYANYLHCENLHKKECDDTEMATELPTKEKTDNEYEISDGNSQEMPTVIEVQQQVDKIKLEVKKTRKRSKKNNRNNRYVRSVGVLLQNLLTEEYQNPNMEEVLEADEMSSNKSGQKVEAHSPKTTYLGSQSSKSPSQNINLDNGDGDEEPPDEKPVTLKRGHEFDEYEERKIKSTMEKMGLCLSPEASMTGQLVYSRKQLRPPNKPNIPFPKKNNTSKKTYFDDDGNYVNAEQQQNENEGDMQTDDDCPEVKSDDYEKDNDANTSDGKDAAVEDPEPILPIAVNLNGVQDKSGDDATVESLEHPPLQDKRRRRKRRSNKAMPPEIADKPEMKKYWLKRHSLFNRFDEGVKLDTESWFSVTPERVARHMAQRCRADLCVDAFCGAGGNALQFASVCERVIAIDIDPRKIELARHNATVYGVADRIEFVVGDFFQLADKMAADVVFLSPPWGGPKYSECAQYDLETMLEPKPASVLMETAQKISHNICLYVPRNSKSEQLVALAKYSGAVEIEQNFLGRRFIGLTAYYGDLVN